MLIHLCLQTLLDYMYTHVQTLSHSVQMWQMHNSVFDEFSEVHLQNACAYQTIQAATVYVLTLFQCDAGQPHAANASCMHGLKQWLLIGICAYIHAMLITLRTSTRSRIHALLPLHIDVPSNHPRQHISMLRGALTVAGS